MHIPKSPGCVLSAYKRCHQQMKLQCQLLNILMTGNNWNSCGCGSQYKPDQVSHASRFQVIHSTMSLGSYKASVKCIQLHYL